VPPEKRGPFVFEHQCVKVEGCGICHDAHGSPNRLLLPYRGVRRLCIQCHGQRHQGIFSLPRKSASTVILRYTGRTSAAGFFSDLEEYFDRINKINRIQVAQTNAL
jgi:predicted CXXCH cytochrome family protein